MAPWGTWLWVQNHLDKETNRKKNPKGLANAIVQAEHTNLTETSCCFAKPQTCIWESPGDYSCSREASCKLQSFRESPASWARLSRGSWPRQSPEQELSRHGPGLLPGGINRTRHRRGGELTQPVHGGDVCACQLAQEGGEVLLAPIAGDAQEGGFFLFAQKHQALSPRLKQT